MVIALLGGLGAAVLWAVSNLASSRSTRMAGSPAVLAWIMIIGLVLNVGAIVGTRPPVRLSDGTLGWMLVAGVGNAFGLLLLLSALRVGKVGIATSITSTEGAVAASLSVLAGESLSPLAFTWLAFIAAGIIIATLTADAQPVPGERNTLSAVFALGAAALSGMSIYATGHVGIDLPSIWALLPARVVGVLAIALPLLARNKIRLPRRAVPLVLTSGVAEMVGWWCYLWGARQSIAVAAVVSSLFAALATLGAFLLFNERLSKRQLFGLLSIACGVAGLTFSVR